MLNFTVGPVQSGETVRQIGAEQVPYFRTPEFSSVMLENERLVKQFAQAEEAARAVFLTGSGTAAMEAAVMNLLDENDRVLVVNGGSFGERFAQLCELHGVPYEPIRLPFGAALRAGHLAPYEGKGFTALLVNVHETSSGVRYDMDLISDFCRRNHLWLIADAISSFLADDCPMAAWGADAMIAGSQKALACPPGVSLVVLSGRAVQRVESRRCKCMYLDLKAALKNAERGQTPFTPAVGVLLQIHARLKDLEAGGGVGREIARTHALALDFRSRICELPLENVSESPSNAVTALHPLQGSAYEVFTRLKDEYGIWVCPNGGEMASRVFRVGHIGALTVQDNITLVNALQDLQRRGLL